MVFGVPCERDLATCQPGRKLLTSPKAVGDDRLDIFVLVLVALWVTDPITSREASEYQIH